MNTSIRSMEDAILQYSSVILSGSDGANGNTAIMAGHQVLQADGELVNLGVFPEVSIQVAEQIKKNVDEVKQDTVKLFSLIDDKRWLHDANIRAAFWENQVRNNTLCTGNTGDVLESFALGNKREVPQLRGLWSEQALMSKFTSRLARESGLKALVNAAIEDILQWETENRIEKEPCMMDGCSISGCSREILQMFAELSRRNIQRLIMFVPNSCKLNIDHACEIGTNHPQTLFKKEKGIVIHNCFLNSGLSRLTGVVPNNETEVFKNCTMSTF